MLRKLRRTSRAAADRALLKKGVHAIRDPKAYLFAALKHEIAAFYRFRARQRTVPLEAIEDAADEISVEDLSLNGAAVDALMQRMRNEPEATQRIFILYYGYGMKLGEIASELHTTEAAVKSRLLRVRKKLRTTLGEENTL